MKPYLIFILFICSISQQLFGQNSDLQIVLTNDGHDTTFIKYFHEKLVLKTYIVSKANNFSVTDVKNEITTNFKPNGVNNLGFGVNYKSFGVSIAFIPLGKKESRNNGRSAV